MKLDPKETQASEEHYRLLFESNPHPMWVYDLQTLAFLTVNDAAIAKYGFTRDEFLRMRIADIRPSEDIPRLMDNIARVTDGLDEAGVWRHLTKDGSIIEVEITSHTISWNGRRAEVVLAQDITERRRAERALRSSEQQYSSLVENVPAIVYTAAADQPSSTLFVNSHVAPMLGFTAEEWMAQPDQWVKQLHPEDRDRVLEELTAAHSNNVPFISEYRLFSRTGDIVWVRDQARTLLDENGLPSMIQGIMFDVTGRKQNESKIQYLARLYAVLSQVNKVIVRTKDRHDLFAAICDVCVKFGQFRMAWIGLIEETTGNIKPDVHRGHEEGYLSTLVINTHDKARSQGPTGAALREGSLRISGDIETDPRMQPWRAESLKRGYRSSASVPFRENNTVIGTLNLYAGEPGFFSEDEKQLLEEIGANISFALDAISAEKRRSLAEEALRLKNFVFDVSIAANSITDADGIIVQANQTFLKLWGYAAVEEVVGKRVSHFFHSEDESAAVISALDRGDKWEGEYAARRKDGTTFVAYGLATTLRNEAGKLIGYQSAVLDVTERKRAEEVLVRLQRAVEDSGEIVFMTNPHGIITYANPEFTRVYGYDSSEVVGKVTPRILKSGSMNPDDYEAFWKTILAKQTLKAEIVNRTKDGRLIHIETSVNPILGDHDNITGYLAVQRDITERKRAEETLRKSEEWFRTLFEKATDGVLYVSLDGGLVAVNESFARMHGYSVAEMHAMNILDLDTPETSQRFAERMRRILEGENLKFEVEHYHRDGHVVPLEVTTSLITIGGERFVLAFQRDITERRRAEEERRVKDWAIESSTNAFAISDLEGNLSYVNPAFLRLWGYDSKAEVMGRSAIEFWQTGKQAEQVMEILREEKGWSGEMVAKRKSGAFFDVQVSASLVVDAVGRPFCMLASFADITERRRAVEALRKSEEKFARAFQSSPDIIVIASLNDGRIVDVNENLQRATGYTSDEIIGKTTTELQFWANPADRERYIELLRNSGQVRDLHVGFRTKSGEIRDTLLSGDIIDLEDGMYILSVIRDITERKRADEALRQSEERFSLFMRSFPGLAYIKDASGKVLFANQGFETILRLRPEEMIGKTNEQLFPPEFAAQITADDKRVLVSGESGELEERFAGRIWSTYRFVIPQQGKELLLGGFMLDITERRKVEEALRNSEYFLRKSQEAGHIGSYYLNIRTGTWISSHMLDVIFGIEKSYPRDIDAWIDIVHPDQKNEMLSYFNEHVVKNRNRFDKEYRIIRHSDQQERWVRGMGELEFGEDGAPVKMIGTIQDITNRKRSEQALHESEERLRRITDTMLDLVSQTDLEGTLRFVSPSHTAILGYSPRELQGQSVMNFVHPDDADRVATAARRIVEGTQQSPLEFRFRHLDGHYVWLESIGNSLFDEHRRRIGMVLAGRDITERKRAEQALRESEERFRTTLYSIGDAVITTDTSGGIVQMNRIAESLTGWKEAEAKGKPIQQVFLVMDEDSGLWIENPVDRVLREGKTIGLANRTLVVARDGTWRPISDSGAPIRNEGGDTIGVVLVFNDQSEQRHLQAQLMQAQKMEAVGRLAGGVAHDFNNMIGVILGYSKLLEDKLDPTGPLRKNVQTIITAAERSANLTKQLLAFARKQVIAPVTLNLNDSLTSLHKMLSRLIGEDIALTTNLDRDLWNVKIDPTQVDQILTNLSTNARDAIDDTGTITIETANVTIDEHFCGEHPEFIPGEYVRLTFADTGKGMDTATLSRVFEPFFTTKPKGSGTGLGLATVFGIVKQNNGFINAESEPGHGTSFTLHFPRHYGATDTLLEKKEVGTTGGTETILIVEDEEQLLELTGIALERYGYTVLPARSPHEAIEICKRTEQRIDLVLTDVVMPGMNGRELKERLDVIRPGLKTIFMSGYTADVVAHRGILEEGVQFLQKPFTPQLLSRRIRDVLDDKS